jgi:AbrB family transcriptional regulator (stage V sporulation protein T)
MKATGVVRRIDDLGRIVLPKELRRSMRIKEGESLEIYTDGENRIILKKYSPVQNVNDFVEEFVESLYASNKKDIIITDNEKVIAYAGNFQGNIANRRISMRLEEKMNKRQTQIIDKKENFEFLENYPINKAAIIKPINVLGDISGSVIVLSENITDVEKSLAEFGGMFMGRYLEG